ncbi:hypothetical protein SDC9_108845 [bioreactor metagenome]|uniref:Uncharacterized protein n=1 Tax=bioreactor metagenome TaxID=1076179 RepID=A0A645B942_9ZZZZ
MLCKVTDWSPICVILGVAGLANLVGVLIGRAVPPVEGLIYTTEFGATAERSTTALPSKLLLVLAT